MADLRKLWEESRGNFYGTILATAFIGLVATIWTGFWPWAWNAYMSMGLPAKILGPLVAIFASICLLQANMLRKGAKPNASTVERTPAGRFGYPSRERIENDPFTAIEPNAKMRGRMEKEGGRDEYYVAQKGMKLDERTYLPAGPAGTPSVAWIPSDELALEWGNDKNGINVSLRNVGTKRLSNVEFKLYSLRTFHKGKRAWRQQHRQEFTFGRTVDLQPDEHTEGHWLAFLSHTGKIELQLPKDSYLPNPETRSQVFEAKIQIMCEQGGRMETICFSWEPGKVPHVLTNEEIYDLEHGA